MTNVPEHTSTLSMEYSRINVWTEISIHETRTYHGLHVYVYVFAANAAAMVMNIMASEKWCLSAQFSRMIMT